MLDLFRLFRNTRLRSALLKLGIPNRKSVWFPFSNMLHFSSFQLIVKIQCGKTQSFIHVHYPRKSHAKIASAHISNFIETQVENEKSLFYWNKIEKSDIEVEGNNERHRGNYIKRFDFSVIVWYEKYPNCAEV